MLSRDHWSYPDDYNCGRGPALSDSLCGVIITPLLEAFSGNPSLGVRWSEGESSVLHLPVAKECGSMEMGNLNGEFW